MTTAAKMRASGFAVHLRIRGVKARASDGTELKIVVEDRVELPDPTTQPSAKKNLYAMVNAEAEAVEDPRAVESFMLIESDGSDGRIFTVISFEESSADTVRWQWLCGASRTE